MLERLIASVSRTTFVIIALGVGIVLMILLDPPYGLCDAQVDGFKERQKSFLYKKKSKFESQPKALVLRDMCLQTNAPGGCYEYFAKLKMMLNDLNQIQSQCRTDVGGISALKKTYWAAADLLVKIAWTEKPPESIQDKKSWLTASDMNLYCNLKRLSTDYFGPERWKNFQEKVMKTLPQAEKLGRNKVWGLSILSENCAGYL